MLTTYLSGTFIGVVYSYITLYGIMGALISGWLEEWPKKCTYMAI